MLRTTVPSEAVRQIQIGQSIFRRHLRAWMEIPIIPPSPLSSCSHDVTALAVNLHSSGQLSLLGAAVRL